MRLLISMAVPHEGDSVSFRVALVCLLEWHTSPTASEPQLQPKLQLHRAVYAAIFKVLA